MSKLVVYMSMSLDGFVAAADDGPGQGLGVGGEGLHAWMMSRSKPGTIGPDGGVDAEVFDEIMSGGAVVVGRHTFEWANDWGGDHNDGVPIFVLSRRGRADVPYDNVHYVADPVSAVEQAKAAAGDRHVMMHGASSVQALLDAGLVDEFAISLVPIVLGRGRRLFGDDPPAATLRLLHTRAGDGVLHLRYAVEN